MSVSKRVSKLLRVLPSEITPVNLEELRRVKQALVELESKADALRYPPSSQTLPSSQFQFRCGRELDSRCGFFSGLCGEQNINSQG